MMIPQKETKEHRLAHWIADQLWKGGLIQFKQTQEAFAAKISAMVTAEFQIEVKLDAEAKVLLAKYEKAADHLDSRKIFFMIKKKLMQEQGLVLWSDPTLSQEDKINHLAHVVQKGILRDIDIEINVDETSLLQAIKRSIALQIRREEEVQALVRERLSARSALEGSEEWDLLYQKAYTELAKKRGL